MPGAVVNLVVFHQSCDLSVSGQQLVHDLLHDFIFPASKLIMDDSSKDIERSLVSPK